MELMHIFSRTFIIDLYDKLIMWSELQSGQKFGNGKQNLLFYLRRKQYFLLVNENSFKKSPITLYLTFFKEQLGKTGQAKKIPSSWYN